MTPAVERPVMPAGYGVPATADGQLPWSYVDERLAAARNYWVGTTRADGRPHAMPTWALWMDGRFYFGTDRGSRKARNLAHNPATVVHLESGDEVVILEGAAEEVTDAARRAALDAAYQAKYEMAMTEAPGDLSIWAVTPRVALAWRERDFPRSATRWVLGR
jgi:nitroimidazol reductase NimA-like FMN-containing flavoprotein (pyridoxamine 5'-phosphate oxidase superfamily)